MSLRPSGVIPSTVLTTSIAETIQDLSNNDTDILVPLATIGGGSFRFEFYDSSGNAVLGSVAGQLTATMGYRDSNVSDAYIINLATANSKDIPAGTYDKMTLSLSGLTGAQKVVVTFIQTPNTLPGSPAVDPGGSGVTSLNSLTGDVDIAAGSGVQIIPSGNTLTISATGTPSDTQVKTATIASLATGTPQTVTIVWDTAFPNDTTGFFTNYTNTQNGIIQIVEAIGTKSKTGMQLIVISDNQLATLTNITITVTGFGN